MTRQELFNKIWSLPNYPYRYIGEHDHREYYTLLGYSGSNQPVDFKVSFNYIDILDDMIKIYDKEELSDSDKSALARNMHNLQRMCEYNFKDSKGKVEHEIFINELSETNFALICKQVEMYRFARELYSAGYR